MPTHNIDHDIPKASRTLAAIWARRATKDASSPFLWFNGRRVCSTGALDNQRAAFASIFIQEGINKGDNVCVLMRNSAEMLSVMLGLWSIGAVVVPLSAQLIGPLLVDQITRAHPKIVIADDELSIHLDVIPVRTINRSELSAKFDPKRDYRNDLISDVLPTFLDPAIILYTSGSTGPSKGCIVSHHFCVYYAWAFWRHMGYQDDDTIYSCLPLNHVHALFASFLPAVLAGAQFSFAERFSASRYWQDIVDSSATTCSAIGPIATILLGQPVSELESRLKVRLAHIAPAPSRAEEFETRFHLKIVCALYGMTEAMIFPPDPRQPPIPGIMGNEPPDWDVRIVDAFDDAVPDGQPGELIARPRRPHILFDSYLDMPDQTVKAWRGLWFRTGDICRRDPNGVYWYMGRGKDLIRRRGENVSAYELETIFAGHPQIAEAAAISIPIEAGEDAIAVVARSVEGANVTAKDLMVFSEDVIPRYMRPDHILVLNYDLPKTQSGKIDKLLVSSICRDQLALSPSNERGGQ